jgi:hypothetical protein
MGQEAEDVIIPVAPFALGWPLTVWMLHGDEHVPLRWIDYTPERDVTATWTYTQRPFVHVLFNSGHYDLLYSHGRYRLPLIDCYFEREQPAGQFRRTEELKESIVKNLRSDGSAIRMHIKSTTRRASLLHFGSSSSGASSYKKSFQSLC